MTSMEVGSASANTSDQSGGPLGRGWRWLRAIQKVGKDDPRRITHSLKEGLALTLVSLIYYLNPLYDSFGSNAIWAVLTVVVVFEFSVGGTLGKGLNRLLATMVGGGLGLGAHHTSSLFGETAEPIILGLFVFSTGAIATYVRFVPEMKARYEYGLIILILTFSMVAVSGYQEDEVVIIAYQRFYTIIIGCLTALTVCIVICPVWIGQDLQFLLALNIEKLANFLQGFESEYFNTTYEDGQWKSKKLFIEGYKSVLNSKSIEETMANLALWEPPHGGFRFRHPWNQYLKVGAAARQCAYYFEALNCNLNSRIQTPKQLRQKIKEPCTKICSEACKALKEIASSLRTMTRSSSTINSHIGNSKAAAENLKSLLKIGFWEEADLLEVVQAAAVATLLMDVVACIEKIAEAVDELARRAKFKKPTAESTAPPTASVLVLHQGTVQPIPNAHGSAEPKHEHVVRINKENEWSPRVINGGEIVIENGSSVAIPLYQLLERHAK